VIESLLRLKNGKAINITENSKKRGRNILPRMREKLQKDWKHMQQDVLLCTTRWSEWFYSPSEYTRLRENSSVCLLKLYPLRFFILRPPFNHPRRLSSHMQHQKSKDEELGFSN
jgi:hypothetical protein